MLRGHLSSVELLRGFFNPSFRRNLTLISVRYADEKEIRKTNGMFSWLKDIFRPDYRIDEAISHDAILPECSKAKQINFKLENVESRKIDAIEKSCESPRLRKCSTEIVDVSNLGLKLHENKDSTWAVWNDVVDNANPKRNYQSPFARHDLLTLTDLLSCPNRRIVSYAPRNTRPPIREPNMPEKREKKDDKKDKKKKKPVIRMESGSSSGYQNESNAKVTGLHDNMDVNFRWDIRVPEESDTSHQSVLKENLSKDMRQIENVNTNEDVNAAQAMRNLQLMMSSAKDTEVKKDDTTELSGEKNKLSDTTTTDASTNTNEAANLKDSLKKILKTSPTLMKETSVDEDYDVPSNASFDAEIDAWKDLVLKSKMPADPSKEDTVNSERQSEMLSIRPEPPEPKLDVQAVPSSSDEAAAEEEGAEHAREFKGNAAGMDVKRASNPTDFQKVDSKKFHTGPSCFSRRKSRSPFSSWILNSLDNDVNFSTDAESSWGNIQRTVSEGASEINREQLKNENNFVKSEGVEENVANAVISKRQQSDKEVSLNRPQSTNLDTNDDSASASSQSDSRKYETDEYLKAQTDNCQSNFDYANPYEDDFYPGYESMSLESTAEQPSERNENSSNEQQQQISHKEMKFVKEMEQPENRGEHTADDNYIKVPGDPYPYSREHFNKWRWYENYGIGPPKTEEVSNSPIDNSNTSVKVDTQQPIRKMSQYSRFQEKC
ncbi:midasin-like [Frieseomelitta varia]|uniref:midasin-like n=1 Tax=Frieseomelitta varia TaxID=561572 RepID=UPI001CB6A9C8|nr:midasin-like [Frieseomelitta varia]